MIESAFYKSKDIMLLCDCKLKHIQVLEKNMIIPRHVKRTKGSREERRWLKSAVNKKLGIIHDVNEEIIREIVKQEIIREIVKQEMSIQNV